MQGGTVTTRLIDGIARITLESSPGNALDSATRHALAAALSGIEAALQGDNGPRGVVLTGANGVFSVGVDLRELDRPGKGAELAAICRRLERLPVPVVAALPGSAIGGGAELALAAHYRLAVSEARFGLPDIVLGLPPGAGGASASPPCAALGPRSTCYCAGGPSRRRWRARWACLTAL